MPPLDYTDLRPCHVSPNIEGIASSQLGYTVINYSRQSTTDSITAAGVAICSCVLGPVREFLDVAKYQPKRFDVEILLHVRKSAVREKFHAGEIVFRS